jgi:hypothetical protein
LFAAACGSTVQASGAGAARQVGDGLAAPAAAGGAGTGADSAVAGGPGSGGGPTTGPGADGSTVAGGIGSSGDGSPVGGSGEGSGAASATSGGSFTAGPGVSAKEIAIGIPYCTDCAAGNAALGAGGDDPGDERRYYQAAIDEVNARGGVLGRKLKIVFHEITASQDAETTRQQACETWTKDNKTAMIFLSGALIYECAKKAGIIAWSIGGETGPVFDRYPNMFASVSVRLERLGAATVNAMVKAGWHKPDATWPTGKIGLITWDDNNYRYAMKNGYLTALHAAGLKEEDVRYVSVPQSANGLGDASAAISSAVLSFRQKGIDHVFIGDGPAGVFTGTGLTLLFLENAQAQSYFPRYGFNSNNNPGWSTLPARQQVGMLAIDASDSDRSNDAGLGPNPQRERCWKLMEKRGLSVGGSSTQGTANMACEIAWFAEAVFTRATAGTTLPQLIAAAESIGTSYRSPFLYGTRITRASHDGVYLFRNARYDEGCSCMQYTSKPYVP